jgi:hypothetical protein
LCIGLRLKKCCAPPRKDYEDIAEDIDLGAIEIRHPELLPQRNHRCGVNA